jgi:hypothetical protein
MEPRTACSYSALNSTYFAKGLVEWDRVHDPGLPELPIHFLDAP